MAIQYEDQLPKGIATEDYDLWYTCSWLQEGVRVGPQLSKVIAARQLLRDAGISDLRIDVHTLSVALVVSEVVARAFAKVIAERLVETSGIRGLHLERPEGAVDVQSIKCACGVNEIRFNQVPLTACPKCGKTIEAEWPDEVSG